MRTTTRRTIPIAAALSTLAVLWASAALAAPEAYRYAASYGNGVGAGAKAAQGKEQQRFESMTRRHTGNRPLTYMEGGFRVEKGVRSRVKLDPMNRQLVVTLGAGQRPVKAEKILSAIQSGKARFSLGERLVAKVPLPFGAPKKARSAISRWKLANPIGKEQILLREIAASVADSVAALAPKIAVRAGRARRALATVRSRLKGAKNVEGARAQLDQLVRGTVAEMPDQAAAAKLTQRARSLIAGATPRQLAQFRAAWDGFIKSSTNQQGAVGGAMLAAAHSGDVEQRIKGWVHLFPYQNRHNVQVQVDKLISSAIPAANTFRGKYRPMREGKTTIVTDVKFAVGSGIFTDNVQVNVGSLLARVDQDAAGRALSAGGLEHAVRRMELRVTAPGLQ